MQNQEQLQTLAAALPENVRAKALDLVERMGAVIEGIGDEPVAWRPPFLRLVQGTTDRGSIPKGTAVGDFILGEEKLEKPLHLIPLRMWTSRQYWDPDQNNARQLCQSPDAKVGYIGAECRTCQFSQWVEGEGSPCGKVHSMLAITEDLSQVFSINFAKSGYKAGTELESLLKKAGVAPYARTYSLDSEPSPTQKTVEVFKVGVLDAAKRRTPEEVLPFLKELFDQIGVSRKEQLEAFYENIKARREAGLLTDQSKAATPAIEDGTGDKTLEIADATPVSTVSAKAKAYTI